MRVLANSRAQHVVTPTVSKSQFKLCSEQCKYSCSHQRAFIQMEGYSYRSRETQPLFYSQQWETGDNFVQSFWWTFQVLSANSCKIQKLYLCLANGSPFSPSSLQLDLSILVGQMNQLQGYHSKSNEQTIELRVWPAEPHTRICFPSTSQHTFFFFFPSSS